jgi:tRNA pseudouridine55 synthase
MRRQARPGAPEGGLVIDKPTGLTSHDVVAAARRALGQPRIGHTGTLDPLATGVLVLLLGRATRLAQYLSPDTKTYLATVAFGQATSTYDAEGEAVGPSSDAAVDPDALGAALEHFRGRQLQVPPAVSAKKVQGERAYALARANKVVRLAPVEVEVHDLALVSSDRASAQVRLTVSAGFYVRALAHDLGQRLGTGAHLSALRRERSGVFDLARSLRFEQLISDPAGAARMAVPMPELLAGWPSAALTADECEMVRHGRPIARAESAVGADRLRLLGPDGGLLGIAERQSGLLHPVLVLM